MANNTKESDTKKGKQQKPGSKLTPFIIIGAIFLLTALGIWFITKSGGTEGTDTNTNAQTSATPNQTYTNAPPGAMPERFKGSATASVVVEEFADYQCGGCAGAYPVINEVVSKYGERVKFIFRNYPLIQNHQNSYNAAVAVEAAGMQGKFWEMQNIVFSNQQNWEFDQNPRPKFDEYAKTLGIDMDKYSSDSLGLAAKNRVDEDMKRGNAIGINTTPSVFINGRLIPNSQITVEGLSGLIDKELAKFEKPDDKSASDSNGNSATKETNSSSQTESSNSNAEGAPKNK
ncbi:MAG: thioredoxin domain-containing protein [Pyrinomonadaceae bacterium]